MTAHCCVIGPWQPHPAGEVGGFTRKSLPRWHFPCQIGTNYYTSQWLLFLERRATDLKVTQSCNVEIGNWIKQKYDHHTK